MKKDKKALVAYAAGIVDGEGSIYLARKYYRDLHRVFYTPRITVGNANGKIVDLLYGLFGGAIRLRTEITGRSYFVWEISCAKAKTAAKMMLPFLRAKKKQAELLIRFQDRVEVGKKKYAGKTGKYFSRIPDRELQKRAKLYEQMKEFNQLQLIKPRAGLTTKQAERLKGRKR